ncbi:hypothetical protein AB0L41_11905 [Amycolatopsis mediterranei]|uniref:hypothetical protein n=1 Tax=Amycolatopsis mediterranei TaxID=33910 RepID=UPI00343A0EDF
MGRVLGEVALPALPVPPPVHERIDAERYLGTYSADVFDLTVSQDDDHRIWIEQVPKGIFAKMGGRVERTELVHYRDGMLIPVEADRGMHMPHTFLDDDGTGHALYLHLSRDVRRAGA